MKIFIKRGHYTFTYFRGVFARSEDIIIRLIIGTIKGKTIVKIDKFLVFFRITLNIVVTCSFRVTEINH